MKTPRNVKIKAGKRGPGRPKSKVAYKELGLRVTVQEYKLIQEATVKEAARLHVPTSRNNFCLRAVVATAKKELSFEAADDE